MFGEAQKASREIMISTRVARVVKGVLAYYAEKQETAAASLIEKILYETLEGWAKRDELAFFEWRIWDPEEGKYKTGFVFFSVSHDPDRRREAPIPVDFFIALRRYGIDPFRLSPGLYFLETDHTDEDFLNAYTAIPEAQREARFLPGKAVFLAPPQAKNLLPGFANWPYEDVLEVKPPEEDKDE